MTALVFKVALFLRCGMVLVFDVFSVLVRLLAISAALFCVFGARGALLGCSVLKFRLRFEVLLIYDVTACFDFDDGCRSFGGVAVDVRRRNNITVLYRSAILVCEIIRILFALRGAARGISSSEEAACVAG
jgi:hypothetical protein